MDKETKLNQELDIQDIKNKYLTFELAAPMDSSKVFAIHMSNVIEILNIQPISPIPYAPDAIKGITNLRGRIVPLLDLNTRFGFEEREYNERTCIIVANINDSHIGLIVNEVYEAIIIENISNLPSKRNVGHERFVTGIAKNKGENILIVNGEIIVNIEGLNPMAI